MDMIKNSGRIIVRPDGRPIEENFVQELEKGTIKSIRADGSIRVEHPHCAFFKSMHSSGEKEFQRTTLYTPEGRLHTDCRMDEEEEPQNVKYVTKPEQLEILLFYLRDVNVAPSLSDLKEKADCFEMPETPAAEFFSFVEKDLFLSVMAEYEIMAKHILNQFRRIYNEKIEILAQKLQGSVKFALFEDIPDMGINEELMERWHFYYIRKARLLK